MRLNKLEVLKYIEKEKIVSISNISNYFEVNYNTAKNTLDTLLKEGRIKYKKFENVYYKC